jgi:hypothetical protein
MAAYSVSKRRRELGNPGGVGRTAEGSVKSGVGTAFRLLTYGSAAGLFLGILASRVLASIVYEATSRDPVVQAGAVLGMALLGLLATWIPARRVPLLPMTSGSARNRPAGTNSLWSQWDRRRRKLSFVLQIELDRSPAPPASRTNPRTLASVYRWICSPGTETAWSYLWNETDAESRPSSS